MRAGGRDGAAAPRSPLPRSPTVKRDQLPLSPRGPAAPRPSWPSCEPAAQLRLVKPRRRARSPIAPQQRAGGAPPPPLTLRNGRSRAWRGAPERGAACQGLPCHHAAPPASPIVKGPSGAACVQSRAAAAPPPIASCLTARPARRPPMGARRSQGRGEPRCPRPRAGSLWARGAAVATSR